MAVDFGRDVGFNLSTFDADAQWSETSGIALVQQDAALRLLTDSSALLPQVDDAGNAVAYDVFDVRALVGLPLSAVQRKQPAIKRAFAADDRITGATVTITDDGAVPLATVSIACSGTTAAGPFRLVFLLGSQPSADDALKVILG